MYSDKTLVELNAYYDEALCHHYEEIAKESRQRFNLLKVYQTILPIMEYYPFHFNQHGDTVGFGFYYSDACDWSAPYIGVTLDGLLRYSGESLGIHKSDGSRTITHMTVKGFLDAFFLTDKEYKKRFKPTADYLEYPQKDPYKPLSFWTIRDKYAWIKSEDRLVFKDLIISWDKDLCEYRVYLGNDKVLRHTDSTFLHYYLEGFMLHYGR